MMNRARSSICLLGLTEYPALLQRITALHDEC
jgi:hypothetical protein